MEEENGGFGRCWGNVYITVRGERRGGFEAFAVLGKCYMCHSVGSRRRINLFEVKKENSVNVSKGSKGMNAFRWEVPSRSMTKPR